MLWNVLLSIVLFVALLFILKGFGVDIENWVFNLFGYVLYPLFSQLAEGNRFFTFMVEGTAKIVVRGDKFEKALIQWEGKKLDQDWNVVEGEERLSWFAAQFKRVLGGLRFYGFWPLVDIRVFDLRWWDLQLQEDGTQKPKFHKEEDMDYILLKPDVYWGRVEAAETKPPERIPVDVEFLLTMRVVNVYKVIYVAPINWTENLMVRATALMRSFVASKKLDELIKLQGDPEGIWRELGQNHLIQNVFKNEWGVEVERGGIQIKSIDLPPDYQEAAAAERIARMKALGEKRRIETEWRAIEKFPHGPALRAVEAAERSPLAAALSVQAIPGITGAFESLLKLLLNRTEKKENGEKTTNKSQNRRGRKRRQQDNS
jgi:hypothetical protein